MSPQWCESAALTPLAVVGLAAGAVAASAGLVPPPAHPIAAGAFGPGDLSAWTQAICTSIGALAAAVNGVAIVLRHFGRPARKPPRAPRRSRAKPVAAAAPPGA